MKRVIWYLIIVMVLSSLLIAGCTQPSQTQAPSRSQSIAASQPAAPQPAQTIKIGQLWPLTGPVAMTGQRMSNAVKFAFEEVGNKVGGKNVEILLEDSTDSPDGALDKAKKLVLSDKVSMIIGPLTTQTKMAIAPFLSQQKVPHIISGPAPLKIADYPYSFAAGGSSPQHPSAMGDYSFTKLGFKTITSMTSDTLDGHEYFGGFKTAFTKKGGQVLQEQYVPMGTSDFGPYFSSLKKSDAVVAWFQGSDAVSFLTQYQQFGVRKNMPLVAIFMGSFFQPIVLNRLPPEVANAMVGECAPTQWSAYLEDPLSKKFIEAYKAKNNLAPEEVESSAYMGAQVALKALQATGGDTTPEKLSQALLALDFESPEGRIKFDQQTRIAMRTIYIAKVDKRDGGFVTVPIKDAIYKDVSPNGIQ